MTITLTPIVPSGQTAIPCVLCAGDARNSGSTPSASSRKP